MERHIKRYFGAVVLAALLFSGCAEKGPILLEIRYQPSVAKPVAAPKTVVGVAPFKDDRGKPVSVLGKQRISPSMENDFVVTGTVSGLVTSLMKDAFTARGFTVKDSSWDGTEQGIKDNGAAILISGEIKALGVNTVANFTTTAKAVVQIKVVVADRAEKKIIRTLEVNSMVEQDMLYSRKNLEKALSEALSAALDRIFKDEELNKKLP